MDVGGTLRRLNPFGPVIGGELRSASRRKRNHFIRLLYLGSLLLVMFTAYTSTRFYNGMSVMTRVQMQQQLSEEFSGAFAMFSIIAMAAIAPVLTSTAINAERRQKTLDVLLLTPISSWQIVSGKLLSRLLVAMMLLGLSLPVLALVRLLGSLELQATIAMLALATSTAVFCGAVGIWLSARLTRTSTIILFAYALLAFWYLFVPYLLIVPFQNQNNPPRAMIWVLSLIQPMFTIAVILWPGAPPGYGPWWECVAVQLGVAAILLVLAARTIRVRHHREQHPTAAKARDSGELSAPLALAPATFPAQTEALAAEATPRRAAHPIEPAEQPARTVGDHPVLWRELRLGLMPGRVQRLIATLVVVAIVGISVSLTDWKYYYSDQMVFANIFFIVACMVAIVLPATAIANEKESQTWQLLIASPLSGFQIMAGKALGLARRLLWPALAIALYFLVVGPLVEKRGGPIYQSMSGAQMINGRLVYSMASNSGFMSSTLTVWIIVTVCTAWASLALAMSLRLERATTAVIVTLLLAVATYALPPALLSIFSAWSPSWRETTLIYEPFVCIWQAFDLDERSSVFKSGWLAWKGQSIGDFPFVWVMFWVGIAHLLIAAVIFYRMSTRFDRYVGRAPARQRRWRIVGKPSFSAS